MTKQNILIVEDESQIRKFLRISLEAHGFSVREARLGGDGLEQCAAQLPDLVILDLGLPDMDGQDVIRRMREWTTIPIIVLSVRSEEGEKVEALDAGANDYVTKPFGISELMARIRSLLRAREAKPRGEAVLTCGDIVVDRAKRRVTVEGKEVRLSKKEYALLNLLVGHVDEVLTHEQILRALWGERHTTGTHHLRVLVGHLRQKIGDEPSRPHYLHTIQGVGYRFAPSE